MESAYQTELTNITWGCGHTTSVVLSSDAAKGAEQIAAYMQIDCLPCAKAQKVQTRGICWSDPR